MTDTVDYDRDDGFQKIKQYLPWVQHPLIVNAPMGEFTGPELACAVTKAGGLGQHGTTNIPGKLPIDFDNMQKIIDKDPALQKIQASINGRMPVGIGFLCVYGHLEELLPTLAKYQPAVVWLYAGMSSKHYLEWATKIREASPDSKIWIQTGSVAAAARIVPAAKPDVLIVQGADAGGHGFENGAGLLTILPEMIDTMAGYGYGHMPIMGAGGVSDGRGVASVVSLGGAGAIMGTRFLITPEAMVHPIVREKIIQAKDGGQSTIRTKMFDDLMGGSWPGDWDSRGLRVKSLSDAEKVTPGLSTGVDLDAIAEWHGEITRNNDGTKSDNSSKDGDAVIWCGCGVGLVNSHVKAEDLTIQIREGARKALHKAHERCESHKK